MFIIGIYDYHFSDPTKPNSSKGNFPVAYKAHPSSLRVMAINIAGLVVLWSLINFAGLVVFAVYADCDPYSAGLIQKIDQVRSRR